MLLLFILYIFLIGVLLWIYASPSRRRFYPWMKLCAGLCFSGIAVTAALYSSRFDLLALMLPALLLSTAGDVVLGFARIRGNFSGKEMIAGMFFFSIAHVLFYLTFAQVYPPIPADFLLPAIVCIFAIALMRSPRMDTRGMLVPCLVYAYFVGLLTAKGVTSMFLFGPSPASVLFLVGSVLFLFSDTILIFMNFGLASKFYLIYINLCTYYTAVALLGMTLLFL